MTTFNGFSQKDFDVFTIDGLDERMTELKSRISPKLQDIAERLEPTVSSLAGDQMYIHVAKHARRKTNPPNDTWAALANNQRGYKKLPHFQIGMWESHVFIWFAVIYESPIKEDFAKQLKANKQEILSQVPDNFVWSKDHTKPETISHKNVKDREFDELVERLETVKKAEILCGQVFNRDDERLQDEETMMELFDEAVRTLMPLYNLTKKLQ
ncbi:YktB family protein [Alkalibacillus salilacus]|uniref:UPF0637 protein J2S77_002098 n=1 Tax=Alkalibacillus salilacus TaxID=284582 RepID=A0ABT9VGR8_9BACI|nr:DUF1054 domain-containing protein [Alkalibacillus salilacus]MDQ0160097.1 uncharacterized protein YktB (UPF0637 family) [Alkalibacillus salilacus]